MIRVFIMIMDVLDRDDLSFPHSLPEFQRMFPDEAACASYLERSRWVDGFVCPHCHEAGEPYRFAKRPGVLRCRMCRKDTLLTAGTIMEKTRTPLLIWFWAVYLVTTHTTGISVVQFQRQLGIKRYEKAFLLLHKIRAAMVRPDQDQIGGKLGEHVEADETLVGGRTRGEGRGVHHKVIVATAVEVRQCAPGSVPSPSGMAAVLLAECVLLLFLTEVPSRLVASFKASSNRQPGL
jgi:hypothetical protein